MCCFFLVFLFLPISSLYHTEDKVPSTNGTMPRVRIYTAKYIQEIKFQKLRCAFIYHKFQVKTINKGGLQTWKCCSRKLSSVVHCTAATGRRFRCDIILGKNEYLYESLVGCMSLRITVWILFCSRIGLSKKIYSKISL